MIRVESALNGGQFVVAADTLKVSDKPVVRLAVHAQQFLLHPDEARRLAVALIEIAGSAEKPEPGDWP